MPLFRIRMDATFEASDLEDAYLVLAEWAGHQSNRIAEPNLRRFDYGLRGDVILERTEADGEEE